MYFLAMYTLSYLFSIFVVEKCDFMKVVKIPYPKKKRFLVSLGSFFSTYKFFPEQEWLIPVSTFEAKYFDEQISSLVRLKKSLFNFPQRYWFWPILANYVHFQSRFSQRTGKISKNPGSVSWRRLLETLLKFELSICKKTRGGISRFASRLFLISVSLACYFFAGSPFVACYACSIVYFRH